MQEHSLKPEGFNRLANMIHPDGIEVYLKPVSPDSDNLKFAEFPLKDVLVNGRPDSDRNMRCAILARTGEYQLVVRCLTNFNMYSATALTHIPYGFHVPPGHQLHAKKTIQRSKVYEQYVSRYAVLKKNDRSMSNSGLEIKDAHTGREGEYDNWANEDPPRPSVGSILVTVYRSKAYWEDEPDRSSTKLYGPGDPTHDRGYITLSSRLLGGTNGRPYYFEFQLRSQAYVHSLPRQLSEVLPGQAPRNSSSMLIEDKEFVPQRERDKHEREKISATYQEQKKQISSQGTDVRNTSTSKPPSEMIRRSTPNFCSCTDPSHSNLKASSVPRGCSPSAGLLKTPTWENCVQHAETSQGQKSGPGKETDPLNEAEIAAVPVCSDCQKLKVPNHKQPAFLARWHRDDASIADIETTVRTDIARSPLTDEHARHSWIADQLTFTGAAQNKSGDENDSVQEEAHGANGDIQQISSTAPTETEPAPPLPNSQVAEPAARSDPAGATNASTSMHASPPTTESKSPNGMPTLKQHPSDPKAEDGSNLARSRKHPTEPLDDQHQRPTKHPRTTPHLGDEHVNETATVKLERRDRSNTKSILIDHEEDDEDQALRAKLDGIDRELRIERLEKERAQVARKLVLKTKERDARESNIKREVIEIG